MEMSEQKNPAPVASKFVVEDYTHVTPEAPDPVTMVLSVKDIFQFVDNAKKNNSKIIVYTVGESVINWT
jgi:hypothetical protein